MIRRWQAWVVFIFAAVIAPVCARADVPVNTWSGAITGTGVLFQFNLSGASSCQVKVTGSPSGLTAAVQTSADQFGAAGWDTASATVGSASITTASNNIFNVAGSGLVGFRVNVSAYTSGTTNLWAACSSAVSHASSGTVTGVTATAPITSSGGTAPNIALTTPLATTFGGTGTASPGLVAGTNITITGSWPNNTINASGGATAYDATILAESSLQHYYAMSDAIGCSSVADSKGVTNLTITGNVVCGQRALARDGETSVFFDGSDSDFITITNGVFPASGSFTIEFVMAPVTQSGLTPTIMTFGKTNTGSPTNTILFLTPSNLVWALSMTNNTAGPISRTEWGCCTPILFDYTWDGTNNHLYTNAFTADNGTTTSAPKFQSADGYLGRDVGTGHAYSGFISKLAIYNTNLSVAKMQSHLLNL